MMNIRKGEFAGFAMIALIFAAAFIFFPMMPEKMAGHWGIDGQVNGYMPKGPALFILPFMALFIQLIFMLISRTDPKRKIMEFAADLDLFTVFLHIFLLYILGLVVSYNLSPTFDMSAALSPGIAWLFYTMAWLMGKTKPNYFIGIRTPWTLENPAVWEKTHAEGAKIFKMCALAALGGTVFPRFFIPIVLVPLAAGTMYLLAYSKNEYNKLIDAQAPPTPPPSQDNNNEKGNS
jgi:uncharacterized membrane protein